MPIIKGYYNVDNGVFLGPMTATNEATNVASTPRYVEGVCFGEYNTDTDEFTPLTNPMRIPKDTVAYFDQDEEAFKSGIYKENVTGIVEDKGSEIASKKISLVNPQGVPLKSSKITVPKNLSVDLDNLF